MVPSNEPHPSKNGVGRTVFEPVTSFVRAFWSVCHRRTESNGEPFTCEKNLATSRWVWGRLNTLAPPPGSYGRAVEAFAGVRDGGHDQEWRPTGLRLQAGQRRRAALGAHPAEQDSRVVRGHLLPRCTSRSWPSYQT
jgi:hypothetical protein